MSMCWLARRGFGLGRLMVTPSSSSSSVRCFSSDQYGQTNEEWDKAMLESFNRSDIDGFEIRRLYQEIVAYDVVPEPSIVAAALRACRRVNDFALTTRILEVTKFKCGDKQKEIWPYMMQELKPTMEELGIPSLEEIGYDKPELALPNPYEIH